MTYCNVYFRCLISLKIKMNFLKILIGETVKSGVKHHLFKLKTPGFDSNLTVIQVVVLIFGQRVVAIRCFNLITNKLNKKSELCFTDCQKLQR